MSEWISVDERMPEPPVAVAENATTTATGSEMERVQEEC